MSKKAQKPVVETAAEDLAMIGAAIEEAAGAVSISDEVKMLLEGAGSVPAQDQNQDQDVAQDQDAAAPAGETGSFKDLLDAVTEAAAADHQQSLMAAFEERARFELEKNPGNGNIQKTISKMIARLTTPGVVRAQVASGRDARFINHSEAVNTRRNVYALEKLGDLLYGAVTGHVKNAINRAVLGSMVQVEGKLPFTGLAAKAAASDKVGIDNAYKALLKRHTVSESTASTQASSTMTALEDLGVVVNTGTRSHPVYSFTATPLALRLKELGTAIATGA